MTQDVDDPDLAATVLADGLKSQVSSYAVGLGQPLGVIVVSRVKNVLIFEVLDKVSQRRVKFKAVVEQL